MDQVKQEQYFRNKVSFLSFICAVLVVFIHTYNITEITENYFCSGIENFISHNIAQVAVPLFFVISAFLFFRNFSLSKLFDKLKTRFRSILIPYLIWNTFYLILFFTLSNFSLINKEPFALNSENIINGIFFYQYNYAFWFMGQLIIFIVFTPLLYLFAKNKWAGAITIIGLFTLFGFNIEIPYIKFDCLVYYLLGIYAAIHFKDRVVNSKGFGWISIPAFVVSQVLFYTGFEQTMFGNILFRLLLIFTFYFAYNFFSNGIKLPNILNCTFPIYCMQGLFIEFLNKLFSFIIPANSNLVLIDYFISPAITIGIIIGISFLLKTKLPKVNSVLFGGR